MGYINVASGNWSFPSRDISESEKDQDKYSLDYSKAIYSRYLRDQGGLLYSDRDDMDLVRLFGKGKQPVSRYKSYLDEQVHKEGSTALSGQSEKSRKGFENINMRVVSPLPRIKTIIKGYLDKVGQDVFVDALDPLSNDMKENMKWKTYTEAQNFEFISEYHLKAGLPMEQLEFAPANMTELNLYEAMGGFKLNYARAMEKLIRHTEDISEMDDDMKDAFIDDAADWGVLAARIVYDHKIGKYRYKRNDPRYAVIQFVTADEYDRSEWAGYIEKWTISELKQIMPDKPEEFFKQVAYEYRDRENNTGSHTGASDWDNFSKRKDLNSSYNYDDFVVEVLETEWIDYECERHLLYESVHGRKLVHKLDRDDVIEPLGDYAREHGAKKDELKTQKRKLRGAKWVIGTEVTFDTGLVNMQDRPNNTEVAHSFKVITLRDTPLTELLIPVADDMAIAWYRWQDDRATLQRAGYTVDVSSMENIQDGGDSFGFRDVFQAWRQSRFLFHQQSLTGKYEGGSTTPIQPIPSMVLEALQEFVTTWEAALKRIEDLTGLNLVMLGATASPGAPVGTTEMSAASAVHVLKPIIKAMSKMKTTLAETTMRRLQLAFKVRPDMVESYGMVVGKGDVELLKQAEKDAVQYGLRFEDRPSEEAKGIVLQAAQASLNARREGHPGISISEFTYVAQQLEVGGNLKELTSLLDFLMMKQEQRVEESKQNAIKEQNDGLARIEEQKRIGAEQLAKMEHEYTIAELDREGQWSVVKEGLMSPPPANTVPDVNVQQAQPADVPVGASNASSGGTSPSQGTNVPQNA